METSVSSKDEIMLTFNNGDIRSFIVASCMKIFSSKAMSGSSIEKLCLKGFIKAFSEESDLILSHA